MITHVAMIVKGKLYSLPKPFRHHNIIYDLAQKGMRTPIAPDSQGFLTDQGEYLDRTQGAVYALNVGQISKLIVSPDLYSEDLW